MTPSTRPAAVRRAPVPRIILQIASRRAPSAMRIPIFQWDAPRALFQTSIIDLGPYRGSWKYAVAPDGERFLIRRAGPRPRVPRSRFSTSVRLREGGPDVRASAVEHPEGLA